MLFNSIAFAIFFPIVFALYWFVFSKNLKIQNILLLTASYVFYAFWDWRFLLLLVFISSINFLLGLLINKPLWKTRSSIWFIVGIIANIGILSYFKYANFFIESFINLFSILGFSLQKSTINIILPLGISFYTFLSISYIIDIYQKKLQASKNLIDVLLTLSFFPIILAGPIQRPISLLPQIQTKRTFNYSFATDGLRQILWGLFMKIVIADRCAIIVNEIFHNSINYSGSTLLFGGICFTIQVYSDFAGYSLIAIGISRLLGFDVMRNFSLPYFSRNIAEFWKRWHISLTTWFRDYVFLPISYAISRKIPSDKLWVIKTDIFIYIVGISITWMLTGLWHGANYTFVIWGGINGFFLIIYQVLKKPRKKLLKYLKVNKDNLFLIALERIYILSIIIVFWVIFRAESMGHALDYISGIFSSSIFTIPEFTLFNSVFTTIILICIFILIEWFTRDKLHPLFQLEVVLNKPTRWSIYYAILITIIFFAGKQQEFLYFQF